MDLSDTGFLLSWLPCQLALPPKRMFEYSLMDAVCLCKPDLRACCAEMCGEKRGERQDASEESV
jgi:hypothetical protein